MKSLLWFALAWPDNVFVHRQLGVELLPEQGWRVLCILTLLHRLVDCKDVDYQNKHSSELETFS